MGSVKLPTRAGNIFYNIHTWKLASYWFGFKVDDQRLSPNYSTLVPEGSKTQRVELQHDLSIRMSINLHDLSKREPFHSTVVPMSRSS
jgi:hypothetical protein